MVAEPEDGALIARYADGDIAAFDALYARHGRVLYRYLRLQGLAADVTAEIFQQVWRRVIGARYRYPHDLSFRRYLLQNAHHCYVEYLKRRPREGDRESPPAPGPVASAATGALAQLLAALAPDQREAVILQQEAGFDSAAIAAVIGMEHEVVHARLGQAVGRLRQGLSAGGAG